jgi:hypothetical protein
MVLSMITQVETLVEAAKAAGIDVPEDIRKYSKADYPHWHLFCVTQIDRPMSHSDSHMKNARVIADIKSDQIKRIGFSDIVNFLE